MEEKSVIKEEDEDDHRGSYVYWNCMKIAIAGSGIENCSHCRRRMLTSLPDEVLEMILSFCHPFDLGCLRATCRRMKTSVDNYVAGLPTSAAMVKSRAGGQALDGEYHLAVWTARYGLVPIQVYCHGMYSRHSLEWTVTEPREYITLKRVGAEFNSSEITRSAWDPHCMGCVRTIFFKVRILLPKKRGQDIQIVRSDLSYTTTYCSRGPYSSHALAFHGPSIAVSRIFYATAISTCNSWAVANIDLSGTGLCVSSCFHLNDSHLSPNGFTAFNTADNFQTVSIAVIAGDPCTWQGNEAVVFPAPCLGDDEMEEKSVIKEEDEDDHRGSYVYWNCMKIAIAGSETENCSHCWRCRITSLPAEVLEMILSFCHPFDLGRLRATCHRMKTLVDIYVAGLPTSATMVKSRAGGQALDGEYHLAVWTARFGLVPLQVYCVRMSSRHSWGLGIMLEPREYITLKRVGRFFNSSQAVRLRRAQDPHCIGCIRTIFYKVRILLPKGREEDIHIDQSDLSYASTFYGRGSCTSLVHVFDGHLLAGNHYVPNYIPDLEVYGIDYAMARSEYEDCLATATIDLRGTGLSVDTCFRLDDSYPSADSWADCHVTDNCQRVIICVKSGEEGNVASVVLVPHPDHDEAQDMKVAIAGSKTAAGLTEVGLL